MKKQMFRKYYARYLWLLSHTLSQIESPGRLLQPRRAGRHTFDRILMRSAQQFQLDKTSTQEQINNLQLKVRSLQQQLQSTQVSLTESKIENKNVQEQITELETVIRKQEQQ